MLPEIRDYDELCRQFRWQIPTHYNIGVDVCDRWAHLDPGRLAILEVGADGRGRPISFGWLQQTSNRLANALAAHGIRRGDRVAILLPQMPEVAAIHGAVYKVGAVALPLFTIARSAWPSPLKSAAASAMGELPATKSDEGPNVPSPLPSRTLKVLAA